MSSNVGNHAIYEDGDQKNPPRSELNTAEPYHEGKEHSHNTNDSKDQASLKNNLARAEHDHKKADYKSPTLTMWKLVYTSSTCGFVR